MTTTVLKPLRLRLEEIATRSKLRLGIIEQDYVLSWLLEGIFSHDQLQSKLIFKGGTALKKIYFGEYRFSEDLDFSTYTDAPVGKALLKYLSEACAGAESKAREFAPIRMIIERYEEKKPHPDKQEAFTVRTQFPWHREPLTVVMIEISYDETLLYPSYEKPLLHPYGESMTQLVRVYRLEEIVLEKLRAILQHTKKLHERDWGRSRARDYYDLWRILNEFHEELTLGNLLSQLRKKCSLKNVTFSSADSFFDPIMVSNVTKTWQHWLGPLVPTLPKCDDVLDDLRKKVSALLDG